MNLQMSLRLGVYFGSPKMRVVIDDYMTLYEGDAREHFDFNVPLDDGNHELKIIHHSKSVEDHLLDDQGHIVQDKFIEIVSIALDGVKLERELWTGRFFPVYLHHDPNEPYFISPNLYLGHNGTWVLDFATPCLKWLIDCRDHGPKLQDTIFKTNKQVLLDMKQRFQDLPDV